ncbi:MAG: hypothetical protein E7372_02945 [Clostridiales bacterium]|nr:hypothetical protein [Clostridiales bacterium]
MAKKKRGLIDRFVMGSEKSEGYARASLPSNRWELGWDIFKGRFSKLFIINLLIILFCLPIFALLVFRYMSILNYGITYPFSQSFGVGYGSLPSMDGAQESIIFLVNLSSYILAPLAFGIAAVGIAGATYVIRNMVWTEGIFVANDFWHGIKKNFKQIAIIMIIYSIVFYLSSISVAMCDRVIATGTDTEWLYIATKVLTYIIIGTFSVMTLHMIVMSVTYDLKLRQLFKNSFIFSFALLPNNAFFIAIALIPFLLLLLDGLFMLIGIVMVFVFGFSLFLLIWVNFCQWSYDKFVNDRIKGAKKNRGIYQKIKSSDSGALKKYKDQLAMAEQTALNSRPVKPITDEELTIAELPTSFSRSDIHKLEQSKQALYDDHERYVEEHTKKDKHEFTEQDKENERLRLEREKRIEKAKRELAKRNKK